MAKKFFAILTLTAIGFGIQAPAHASTEFSVISAAASTIPMISSASGMDLRNFDLRSSNKQSADFAARFNHNFNAQIQGLQSGTAAAKSRPNFNLYFIFAILLYAVASRAIRDN